MNISLPDELKSFIDAQVEEHGYGSTSEYLRDLIRRQRDALQLRPRKIDRRRLFLSAAQTSRQSARMTAKPIALRPEADLDIHNAVNYHRREGGPKLAGRWIDALQAGLNQVGSHPATGSTRYTAVLQLAGLRFWPLKKFPYLIFYIERDDHVDVWRVLHAERDVPAWLSE
jgi:toxin ParE1/3/4